VLVLCGTKDPSEAGDRYRTLLPPCHFIRSKNSSAM
jgi:hypothetical protein